MNNTFSLDQIAETKSMLFLIRRQHMLDKMAESMEMKSIESKMKQSEIAKELKISPSTKQRYTGEVNMLSLHRIPSSSTTHKRKRKISTHTQHDLKMTSNDLKVNSNDLKKFSNEPVKTTKNKLRGDMSDDNPTQGSVSVGQALSSNAMTEFIKIL